VHIAIIGGLDRNEARFEEMAREAGHSAELHVGDLGGRGSPALEAAIARADLVVIVTEINSHGAVRRARDLARARGRRALLVRKFGSSQFAGLLDALDHAPAA